MIKLKNLLFLSFILSITILVSCNKKNDLDINSNKIDILLAMGFNKNDIQEFDDYFIVEDDMVFIKEYLNEIDTSIEKDENAQMPSSPPEQFETTESIDLSTKPVSDPAILIEPRQRRFDDLVSGSTINNVRVKIHSSMDDWKDIIKKSLDAWNNAGAKVNLKLVSSNPHIRIYADSSNDCPSSHRNLPDDVCGRGAMPQNGLPGNLISINIDIKSLNTKAKKIRTMTHELGHNIGLAHTASGDGEFIQGTLAFDPGSLMNAGECATTKTLSEDDIIAIKSLYPKCSNSIGEWFNSSIFGWMYNGGDSWFYLNKKNIWIYADTNQDLCRTNISFYATNLCGETGWFYTGDDDGWFYNNKLGWFNWDHC